MVCGYGESQAGGRHFESRGRESLFRYLQALGPQRNLTFYFVNYSLLALEKIKTLSVDIVDSVQSCVVLT